MSTEFEREKRYLVFKLSDVEEHFTPGEKQQLARLVEVQRVGREEAGKAPLECVVVESDWPEYEPTWNAIEARMTGAQPTPSDEYVGWYCAHCERGVDASEVTYHEQHTVCGRVITDDRPPKSAPIIPEGWKLVPIEPTPTMITAALESNHAINAHRAEHCYRAMLAAAPEAKP